MKTLSKILEQKSVTAEKIGEDGGYFYVVTNKFTYCVIESFGGGWDHVSVSILNVDRCPRWSEMCMIKDLFFESHENVMQLHPQQDRYVNNHPYCLHLWRPQNQEIPLPPTNFV